MITKNVKLYLGDGFPVRIPMSQYDTMWQFVFTIIHNSQPWQIPSGATAVLNGRKPDGNVFAFSGTIANNTVTVDADVQMTAVAGQTVCELSILSDGKVVGTANFILDVEAAPKSPNDVSSDSTLPAYAEMLEMFSGDITNAVDAWLNSHASQIGGLTNEAKQALLTLLAHVAYTDDQGQTYLDALETALYPPVDLLSISAVFNQGQNTIYDTDSLDTLKQYLTVTANYSDGTTETVSAYTLSGTLAAGTSTITVNYGGKSDTFSVTVSVGLDSIAFGSVTYRQLFEGTYKVVNFNFNDNSYSPAYINSGNPVISGAEYSSKPYSLKAFGTTSTQIRLDGTTFTQNKYYYAAVRVMVDRYSAGKAGFMPATGKIELYQQSVTDGFVAKSSLEQFTGNTGTWQMYIGSWSSANLDCYVDDCVVVDATNLFDNLSDAAARATAKTTMDSAYQTYISIMNNA